MLSCYCMHKGSFYLSIPVWLKFLKCQKYLNRSLARGNSDHWPRPFSPFVWTGRDDASLCFLTSGFWRLVTGQCICLSRNTPGPCPRSPACLRPLSTLLKRMLWQWKPTFPLSPYTQSFPFKKFLSCLGLCWWVPHLILTYLLLTSFLSPWFPGWSLLSFLSPLLLPGAQHPAASSPLTPVHSTW